MKRYLRAKCADFALFWDDRDVQDAALYYCAFAGVVVAIMTAVQS